MFDFKRYDMNKKPIKERWFLTPLAYALSFPSVWARKLKVKKTNMEGLNPPYILLCTHHAFIDFKVTTKAIFPHRATYVVAIDGFIKREWLLRNVGGICKRKFTNDITVFKHIKYTLENLKQISAIYPEARYSLSGTQAILPDSLGKMVKVLKKPVVVLNMHGNHLHQPVWNLRKRKVPLMAEMTQIISKEEISQLTVDQMNQKINEAFIYDEYLYQKQNKIKIKEPFRAEGLHRILYKCPECLSEKMSSNLSEITCENCHQTWHLDVFGYLKALKGETKFEHIPDWFSWQKEVLKNEIKQGNYMFEDDVRIEALPNSKGYIPLGKGRLKHTMDGFELTFDPRHNVPPLVKPSLSMYGLHIEYDYFKKG